jgi:hypothetical protein
MAEVLEVLKRLELIEAGSMITQGEPKFTPVQTNHFMTRAGHER